jgi:hypothetical protein
VNAEFNWWLLIVGVVVGAVLTYLVLADSARREHDVVEREVPAEAAWLSRTLADEGLAVDADTTEAVLRAHRRYLQLPPPDALVDPETLEPIDDEVRELAAPPESLAIRPPETGPSTDPTPGEAARSDATAIGPADPAGQAR